MIAIRENWPPVVFIVFCVICVFVNFVRSKRQSNFQVRRDCELLGTEDLTNRKNEISKIYMGFYGIHGVGRTSSAITIYYDRRRSVPKQEIIALAKPWPVKFKKQEMPTLK